MMIAMQSMLFVPGNKPDRFVKALASGADSVCIDLEDAVPPDQKAKARAAAISAVQLDKRIAIRTNALSTAQGLADLLALAEADSRPALVYLPMVEDAAEIRIAQSVLADGDVRFIPLIETVKGLSNAADICAHPAVAMVMLGGADFSVQLGVELAWEPLLVARSQLVMAAAGAGKGAIDVPWIHFEDMAGLAEETRKAKALGFMAKGAIHPAQIAPIHEVYRPTFEQIEEAREAEKVFQEAGGAAVRFRGRMLDAPVIKRYRQILALGENQNA
jgi:(S)-citramalyl-CoA lyase